MEEIKINSNRRNPNNTTYFWTKKKLLNKLDMIPRN